MNKRRLILLLLLLCAGVTAHLLFKPELRHKQGYSQVVYSHQGQLLRLTLSADEKYRLWVPLEKISPQLINTTLLHEDRYFYYHPGINPVALLKAFWQTYVLGGYRRGASTITMQLARMRFAINSRSLPGKFHQIIRSFQLEWYYSKDELLEAYLNTIPYGGNIEGVAAASLIYFDKPPQTLNLHEALTLTVIPQSPQRRLPFAKPENMTNLITARNRLLRNWLQAYPHDNPQRSLLALTPQLRSRAELPFLAPHFVNSLLRQHADTAVLETTLDVELQKLLQRSVRSYIESKQSLGFYNATAMLIDTRNMAVRAVLGSADFRNAMIHGQVNGTQAKRSPGSTLKPFIYALGFDQGLIHPMSMLKDAPTSFGAYNPENFDEEFSGPITVRDALVRSRNLPAVQVAARLAKPDLYGFMKQAGVSLPRSRKHYGLSLVLGGAEVTMEELVTLYAALANQGMLKPLRTLRTTPASNGHRILSAAASYLTLDMLKHNPRPSQSYRSDWLRHNIPVYWKTGTSYAYRDAWSIAIFGDYLLAVWVGNFDGRGNPAFVGRDAAAPLLFRIIDAVRVHDTQMKIPALVPAPAVQAVELCAVSGKLPTPHCKHKLASWFIPGISPIDSCSIHRPVYIDKQSGLRACTADPETTRKSVYEFWPSDLLKIFRQAGIPRRLPPPYLPACQIGDYAEAGQPPEIHSPRQNLIYQIRSNRSDEKIPFMAVTDTDARYVYWFLDERYLGKARQGEALFWLPKSGEYIVRVLDEFGRGASRKLKVVTVN